MSANRLATFVAVAAILAACSDPPAPDYQAPAGMVPIATDTPTPPPLPSEAEIKAQSERWTECALNKIRELDDGRSDAATIAIPVEAACRSYLGPRASREGSMQITIAAVLKLRTYDNQVNQAITPEWRDCVLAEMRGRDLMTGQVKMIATLLAVRCRHVFSGPEGSDVDILSFVVSKIRSQPSTGTDPLVVSPPQPLPPADKHF
jgi:hypothetical protein